MMRTDPPGDGTQASKWFTADIADGWDAGATEKGTPGSSNYTAGPLDHFDIDIITNQKVGVAFPITVTAKDASGVTVFIFNGTVDISDLTGTVTPTVSGNFSSGSWTDNVTISQEKTGDVITVTNSNGTETGLSNNFDVTVAPGAGNVVINELMWMGSTSSTADEWIELKNTTNNTIDLSGWQLTRKSGGNETQMLEIPSGTISANGYFLISNNNETNSQIAVTPDLVETAVSLANNQLQIKLYDGQWDGNGNLLDTADDGIGAAAAGDNTNKYSMMRTDPPGDGTLGTNWFTADKAFGWDASATELGTPGFSNDGLDFGDLPPSHSLTTSINNGARHNIGNLYLGTAIDSEIDGQESSDAGRTATDGDDGNGSDDENGVTVNGDWKDGTDGGAVDVTVSSGSGYLSAWIDWDNNNNFTDAGDQVLNMNPVVAGAQTIQFDVPDGAIATNNTYDRFARFRLVPDNGEPLTLTGLFNNGEVEDYYLQFIGVVHAAPTVTTDAATTVGTTGATLNGTVNANNSSTTVTFEYGLDTNYSTTVTADQSPVTGNTNTAVSKSITGLTSNTTYHYRAVGQNAGGTTNGSDKTFTTGIAAPTVTTNAASAVGTTNATLNGTVNGNNASTTVTFEYGTDTSYGTTVTADQSPVTGSTNTAVSKAITGLTNNTTYHYRAVGQNAGGNTNGSDKTFTTGIAAPTVTTNAASAVGTTDATLNGTVNGNNASTTVTFEYGTTTAYGTTVTADQSPVTGNSNMAVSKAVTGLIPNTTYHYRAVGQNAGGTTNGADMTFTTGTAAPTVTTDAASAVGTTNATLNGTVNGNNASTTVTFQYGTTTAYGTTVTADQSPVTGSTNTVVNKVITGLTNNITYHYRAVGQNAAGTNYGADMTFTTGTAAPEIDVQRPAGNSIADGGPDNLGSVSFSNSVTYTIDNTTGSAQLNVTSVKITGETNCSNFSHTTMPINIAAGITATLDVSFDVNAAGAFSFDLKIYSNDSDENPYDIAVSGTVADTDNDGVSDADEGVGDRDGDGIPNNEDYDPTGYFYDEDDGKIIAGGQITVIGPGAITMVQDGSSGYYQFLTDGTAGIYTIAVTLPPGYVWSTSCLVTTGALNPPALPNPYVLGNGENGNSGYLTSNACTQFYLQFDLEPGDPFIFNNNFPLNNLQPINIVLSSFTAVVENNSVLLNWETETEPNNAGFYVLRSLQENSDYIKINPSLIPAQGDAFTGAIYAYTDLPGETGTFYYKLQSISLQGDSVSFGPITVSVSSIDIKRNIIPGEYFLSQNYPNPFNPETIIEYGLPKAEQVVINIYDLNGQQVRNLVSQQQSAGNYLVKWNGRDNNGNKVVSGLYFYYFKAGSFSRTLKMILIK